MGEWFWIWECLTCDIFQFVYGFVLMFIIYGIFYDIVVKPKLMRFLDRSEELEDRREARRLKKTYSVLREEYAEEFAKCIAMDNERALWNLHNVLTLWKSAKQTWGLAVQSWRDYSSKFSYYEFAGEAKKWEYREKKAELDKCCVEMERLVKCSVILGFAHMDAMRQRIETCDDVDYVAGVKLQLEVIEKELPQQVDNVAVREILRDLVVGDPVVQT